MYITYIYSYLFTKSVTYNAQPYIMMRFNTGEIDEIQTLLQIDVMIQSLIEGLLGGGGGGGSGRVISVIC